jgi:histone-lysine N-methyltransferase SETMAR
LVLQHDNVPAHTYLKTTEFVTNNNMVIVPHPPYSFDLAPSDFALFPKLNSALLKRGKNDGIAVYVPKETILQEMATKIE